VLKNDLSLLLTAVMTHLRASGTTSAELI